MRIDGTPATMSKLTMLVIAGVAASTGNGTTGAFGNGSGSTLGAVAAAVWARSLLTRDCGAGSSCTLIPRIDPSHPEAREHLFFGCLQSKGTLAWTSQLQPKGATDKIFVPVPASAHSFGAGVTKVAAVHPAQSSFFSQLASPPLAVPDRMTFAPRNQR